VLLTSSGIHLCDETSNNDGGLFEEFASKENLQDCGPILRTQHVGVLPVSWSSFGLQRMVVSLFCTGNGDVKFYLHDSKREKSLTLTREFLNATLEDMPPSPLSLMWQSYRISVSRIFTKV